MIDAHAKALSSALNRRRSRASPIKVLIDLTEGSVQPPSVVAALARAMRAIYHPRPIVSQSYARRHSTPCKCVV